MSWCDEYTNCSVGIRVGFSLKKIVKKPLLTLYLPPQLVVLLKLCRRWCCLVCTMVCFDVGMKKHVPPMKFALWVTFLKGSIYPYWILKNSVNLQLFKLLIPVFQFLIPAHETLSQKDFYYLSGGILTLLL